MEEEEFVGCISCMGTNDLCDLFGAYAANVDTYAQMLENCFNIKVTSELKYLCSDCVEKLEKSITFKDQTVKNMSMLQTIKDEEYLDESILEEEENIKCEEQMQKVVIVRKTDVNDDEGEIDGDEEGSDSSSMQCRHCCRRLRSAAERTLHERAEHAGQLGLVGQGGLAGQLGLVGQAGLGGQGGHCDLVHCDMCGLKLPDLTDHLHKCHGEKSEMDGREFPCHFCDNVYTNRKACFTHLRMKHGLKLYNDQTPRCTQRERKKCHMCNRDFSQKQILNKHLWKAHGIEVEKRKAFICPLCNERVSYGNNFSAHLLHRHRVHEQVEQLEFHNMDEFLIFKSAIQEETKYRFRKISASRQVIDGIRSTYMCSQSGEYVYQGKGKRPAPERQIYKTGKACPAHMIVTETLERVLVTFYKTHVGHGLCPYYEPREVKKPKLETITAPMMLDGSIELKCGDSPQKERSLAWICDTCGMGFLHVDQFMAHISQHEPEPQPCRYCSNVFDNIEAWSLHVQQHNNENIF